MHDASNLSDYLDAIAGFMYSNTTAITLYNLICVVAGVTKAGATHFWAFVPFLSPSTSCT